MTRALQSKMCIAHAKVAHFEGNKTNLSLEAAIRQILEKMPHSNQRKTSDLFDTQITELTNFALYDGGGVAILIDCHSPDNEASAIKRSNHLTEKSAKTRFSAPKGHNMVKYDVFAYIKDNNVLLAGDAVKDYVFDGFINHLARAAKVINSELKICTSAATAKDKMKLVKRYGVSKIELNISSYAHELEEAAAAIKPPISKPFSVLRDILNTRDAEGTLSSSHIRYSLVVDISKLKKGQLHKAPDGDTIDPIAQWASKAAQGVLEDYIGDYTIVLRGGGKIQHSEMKVSRPMKVTPHGKSFDTDDMWFNLRTAYKNLCNENVF